MDNVTLIRMLFLILFLPFLAALLVVPFWKIFSKAGFSGWLALLMPIPLVSLIVLYYVAFSTWKTRQTSN